MKFPKYRTETAPASVTMPLLHTAEHLGWDALYEEHLNDYSALFGRVSLRINDEEKELPADKLLEAYRAGDRAAMNRLETLYFSYGRYPGRVERKQYSAMVLRLPYQRKSPDELLGSL